LQQPDCRYPIPSPTILAIQNGVDTVLHFGDMIYHIANISKTPYSLPGSSMGLDNGFSLSYFDGYLAVVFLFYLVSLGVCHQILRKDNCGV
jgi:hypothetical protein